MKEEPSTVLYVHLETDSQKWSTWRQLNNADGTGHRITIEIVIGS